MTDPDEAWTLMKAAKRAARARARDSLKRSADRLGLSDRVTYPAPGTCLLDGRVYYYAQSRKARVKGTCEYRQMKGVQHFFETFSVNEEGTASQPTDSP